MDWAGQRVAVLGLGSHGGGVGAARFLSRQGAQVVVADRLSADALAPAMAALSDCPTIEWILGGYAATDLQAAHAVIVNPAVRPDDPCLADLIASGVVPLTEIDLFLEACPAHIVGITGTTGKSSTTAMLAGILAAEGRRSWQGGNLGGSLLDDVGRMTPDDWVALELSSFQLHRLARSSPGFDAAIITNLTPNHLDWHPDMAHYAAAKQRLLTLVRPSGVAVFDRTAPGLNNLPQHAAVAIREPRAAASLIELQVAGTHQRRNAACAAAVAEAVGCSHAAIEAGLRAFRGLPHRLERVGEYAGRRFFNDSKSTTPAATLAAVEALKGTGKVWLLLGGVDKGSDLTSVASGIANQVQGIALYGACRNAWADVFRQRSFSGALMVTETLANAFAWCLESSGTGSTLLLSPGCASWDQFTDYRARGEAFVALVRQFAGDEANACRSVNASLESRS